MTKVSDNTCNFTHLIISERFPNSVFIPQPEAKIDNSLFRNVDIVQTSFPLFLKNLLLLRLDRS